MLKRCPYCGRGLSVKYRTAPHVRYMRRAVRRDRQPADPQYPVLVGSAAMDALAVLVLIAALNLMQWQDRRSGRVRFTKGR